MAAAVSANGCGTHGTERRGRPTKLFIGGLTRNTTTKTLRDHFCSYGSVLDCVAMRMADGRPRGFGYVTLDSSAAADRILAQPQVIDGRVVDMKRAVPEGTGSSPKGVAEFPKPRLKVGLGEPMRVPEPVFCPWTDAQYACSPTAAFLGTAPMSLPRAGHFIASAPIAPAQGCSHLPWSASPAGKASPEHLDCVQLIKGLPAEVQSPLSPIVGLSARAPEFTPSAGATATLNAENGSEPDGKVLKSSNRSVPESVGNKPMTALSDITNIVHELAGELKDSKVKQKTGHDTGCVTEPVRIGLTATTRRRKNLDGFEILVDSSDADTEKSSTKPEAVKTNAVAIAHSGSADSEYEEEQITAYSVLPGLPPIRTTALPAPLPLPSNFSNDGAYPGIPPCLPPGLDMWEPDGETSPLCVSSFNGTPLSSAPGVASLSTTHAGGHVLSTTPWSVSAPPSAAATPLANAAGTMPFGANALEPVSVVEKMGLLSQTAANGLPGDANPALIASISLTTCTVGTQTEEGHGQLCSKCQAEISGVTKMMAAQGGA